MRCWDAGWTDWRCKDYMCYVLRPYPSPWKKGHLKCIELLEFSEFLSSYRTSYSRWYHFSIRTFVKIPHTIPATVERTPCPHCCETGEGLLPKGQCTLHQTHEECPRTSITSRTYDALCVHDSGVSHRRIHPPRPTASATNATAAKHISSDLIPGTRYTKKKSAAAKSVLRSSYLVHITGT